MAGGPHARPAAGWMIRFGVRDTGTGMNEAARARLFQPFSQGDSSITRRFGGTGLGLAIAKQLVEVMGGTIEVESTDGKGSLFQFTVCLGKREPMSMPSAATAIGQQQRNLSDRQAIHVLLAEDNPINELMASRFLQQLGCHVEVTHDGHEAVARASAGDFDVILMDWQMPVMDGLEATAQIRRHESLKRPGMNVPVIAVTANVLRGDRERCTAAGVSDYLSKPFSKLQLKEMLARHLPDWMAAQPQVQ
ncbi:MAG: response regulator [Betaproteobacteria bacterium]|nr:response regulator [Betaproteobacteria bacterium]